MRVLEKDTLINRARQEALFKGELTTGYLFNRKGVMTDLADLFGICFKFGGHMNPLPGIRKCFPLMTWKFWEINKNDSPEKRKAIAKAIMISTDFLWTVPGGLITASHTFAQTGIWTFWLNTMSLIPRQELADRIFEL
jgi:hypothetical protein